MMSASSSGGGGASLLSRRSLPFEGSFSFFLSGLACPSRCVYCDQRLITGSPPVSPGEVRERLSSLAGSGEGPFQVCFFGGSFTCMERSLQRAYLEAASTLGAKLWGIRVSTHPLCVDEEALGLLRSMGVRVVEVGVQSFDDEVLSRSGRGHGGDLARRALDLVLGMGFELVVQLMVGLPGQGEETFMRDVEEVVGLKRGHPGASVGVRIYPCLVLEGTELQRSLSSGEYEPLSLERALELSGRAILRLALAGVEVVRVGLQWEESLSGSVVAGPHHPAFGELARAFAVALALREGLLGFEDLSPRELLLLRSHGGMALRLLEGSLRGLGGRSNL